ncbi:MAG: type II secretion system protein GspN [Candidatus Dadabacteria bacterium]|nr:type II secretion system protein GspN [Candidatus Dadabacteria bacterium]
MKEKIKKYKHIKPVSYTLFFLVVFTLFLFMTFPGDVIKKRIIAEIESNTPYKADIQNVRVSPLLKINMEGVKLSRANSVFLELENLDLSPSPLSVFSDNPKVPFTAKLWGGEISGSIRINKTTGRVSELDATLESVRINSVPSLFSEEAEKSLSLGGVIDGEVNLVMIPPASGDIQFEITGLKLENMKLKGITLPNLTDLTSMFKGTIEGDMTRIDQFRIAGADIDLDITGTTPLPWEIQNGGVIDIGYSLQMKGGPMAKYKGLLSPYLATQRDGSLGGKILGTVANPRFEQGSITRF